MVWGMLITCAVTRAVHIELVTDMTTHKFLQAFTILKINYTFNETNIIMIYKYSIINCTN